MGRHFIKRLDGRFQYRRRVPRRYQEIDPRGVIMLSLNTDDEAVAIIKTREHDRVHEEFWTSGEPHANAWARYKMATMRARLAGFEYRPMVEIASGPLEERVARFLALKDPNDAVAVDALLGGVPAPGITLRGAWERYEGFAELALKNKSDEQRRKWRLPRDRAVENFCKFVKRDPELRSITREETLRFQQWWSRRVIDENLTVDAMNKDLRHLSMVFQTVNDRMHLKLENPFLKLTEKDRKKREKTRGLAFPPDFVRGVLLNPASLATLNDEAKAVIWIMAETGARPSEIVNLPAGNIHLKAKIPYIEVEGRDDREVKSERANRKIPLLGSALFAFQTLVPHGFTRYREKEASLSAAVNKFLKQHGLRPDKRMTLYSLRHTFSDRLTNALIQERIIADLMGHSMDKPIYGEGGELVVKHQILSQIVFPFALAA